MKQNVCKSCGVLFPNWLKIDGQRVCLSGRSYCLTCSPKNGNNRRNLKNYKMIDDQEHKYCKSCDTWKTLDGFHITKHYKSGRIQYSTQCRLCHNTRSKRDGQLLKRRAILYKGNSCFDCHQVFHDGVYDFHHRDPHEKDFAVSDRIWCRGDWAKLASELDKCDLLCSNCHRLRHCDPQNALYCPPK